MPGLEAEGVILRPFEVKDAAALVAACRDAAILRFTFMQDGLTEAGAVEWINRSNERWLDGYPRFAIVDPDDDRLLGQVGLNVNVRHLDRGGPLLDEGVRPPARGGFQRSGLGC